MTQDTRHGTQEIRNKVNNPKSKEKESFTTLYSPFVFVFLYSLSIILCLMSCVLCQDKAFAQEDNPLSFYEVIEERNIFRPKAETSTEEQEETDWSSPTKEVTTKDRPKISDLILTGIIKIRNKYKAILERKSGGKGYYVTTGGLVDDYTVTEIRKSYIVLKKDGKYYTLNLRKSSAQKEPSKEKTEEKIEDIPKETAPQELKDASQHKFKNNVMQNLRMGVYNEKK